LEELEALRFALVGAASRDPAKEWAASSAYATIDQRIIGVDGVTETLQGAERDLHQHISELFATVAGLLRACYAGRETEAAERLIAQGESFEGHGQLVRARQFYEHALRLSLPLPDRSAQIRALRRIGRVLLTCGDLSEAHQYYTRCIQVARDTDDVETEVNARIGAGNALLRQGHRRAAEVAYHDALARIGEAGAKDQLRLQRAQIYNNLAVTALRQDQLAEAEKWLDQVAPLWETVVSPVDVAIYFLHRAELRTRQGDSVEGRRLFEYALSLSAAPSAIRAIIAIDLAGVCMSEGYVQDAIYWAREAEDYAIAARSVDYLCHVYRGLGNIARDTGHEDGVAFYEKALDLARTRGLSLSEGQTLLEYAELRARADGMEEARVYLQRAREILLEIGAAPEARRAEEALAKLGAPEDPHSEEPAPIPV
jgi:tetratricopeptide (TPR) repeat protein